MKARVAKKVNKDLAKYRGATIIKALCKHNRLVKKDRDGKWTNYMYPVWHIKDGVCGVGDVKKFIKNLSRHLSQRNNHI